MWDGSYLVSLEMVKLNMMKFEYLIIFDGDLRQFQYLIFALNNTILKCRKNFNLLEFWSAYKQMAYNFWNAMKLRQTSWNVPHSSAASTINIKDHLR